MLTMTPHNLIPATLAEKMLHMREQVPRKTTNEVGRFFGIQVNTPTFAYMIFCMVKFVSQTIDKL